eukprot:1273411-Rhodomonas_salina.1
MALPGYDNTITSISINPALVPLQPGARQDTPLVPKGMLRMSWTEVRMSAGKYSVRLSLCGKVPRRIKCGAMFKVLLHCGTNSCVVVLFASPEEIAHRVGIPTRVHADHWMHEIMLDSDTAIAQATRNVSSTSRLRKHTNQ